MRLCLLVSTLVTQFSLACVTSVCVVVFFGREGVSEMFLELEEFCMVKSLKITSVTIDKFHSCSILGLHCHAIKKNNSKTIR